MSPHVGFDRDALAADEPGLRRFARLCVRQGVTTAADLASMLPDEAVEMMTRVTGEADFPARIVSLRRLHGIPPAEIVDRALDLRARSSERLRLGIIKIRRRRLDPRVFPHGCAGPAITTARPTAYGM